MTFDGNTAHSCADVKVTCIYIPLGTGVVISPYSDLLPDVFCMMVRMFRLMLVLLYINSTNIPPIMIINRI